MFDLYNSHTISYRGKVRRVCYLTGLPQSIHVDNAGRLYLSYWKLNDVPGPKSARRAKVWRQNELRYRQFKDVFALFRAVEQIIGKTETRVIPRDEDLIKINAEIKITALDLKSMNESALAKLKQEIARAKAMIEPQITVQVREAAKQLECVIVLRDKLNRLNPGMIQVRMVTVNDRLVERLEDILTWLQNYHAWKAALHQFERYQIQSLGDFNLMVGALPQHAFFEGKLLANTTGLGARIDRAKRWLKDAAQIGGLNNWAKHCLDDLEVILNSIAARDVVKAKTALTRVTESVRLKTAHFELQRLTVAINEKRLLSTNNWHDQATVLRGIITKVATIDDTAFAEPVVKQVNTRLEAALAYLHSGGDKRAVIQAKSALNQAMALI